MFAEEQPPGVIPEAPRRCTGVCGKLLPAEEFYKAPQSRAGRQPTCKACVKQRVKDRRAGEARQLMPTAAVATLPMPPSAKDARYITDEDLLIAGGGSEHERRAALAAILARAAMARAAPAAADELTIRLELATTILDRMANGGALQEAVAQARSFVMIERSCGRYRRKIK